MQVLQRGRSVAVVLAVVLVTFVTTAHAQTLPEIPSPVQPTPPGTQTTPAQTTTAPRQTVSALPNTGADPLVLGLLGVALLLGGAGLRLRARPL